MTLLKEMGLNMPWEAMERAKSSGPPRKRWTALRIPSLARAILRFRPSCMAGEEEAVLAPAGQQIKALAKFRTGLQAFKDAIYPSDPQGGPVGIGKRIGDAVDAVHERLGNAVGVIRNEALALAQRQGKGRADRKRIEPHRGAAFAFGILSRRENRPAHEGHRGRPTF
jgi:hypothetical protein